MGYINYAPKHILVFSDNTDSKRFCDILCAMQKTTKYEAIAAAISAVVAHPELNGSPKVRDEFAAEVARAFAHTEPQIFHDPVNELFPYALYAVTSEPKTAGVVGIALEGKELSQKPFVPSGQRRLVIHALDNERRSMTRLMFWEGRMGVSDSCDVLAIHNQDAALETLCAGIAGNDYLFDPEWFSPRLVADITEILKQSDSNPDLLNRTVALIPKVSPQARRVR